MIKVCPNCSNVDYDALQEKFGEDHVELNCLGECGMNEDQSFGYVFDKWVIHDEEDAFMADVEARMKEGN
ncbi:DUF1450 domain-containing protein [Fusibacter sp. JL216-2]|uniref:DUF1450 domain-containing protein n=1 Tax=Fusibacter sp. JL216-2 TaxID=3071453 RepID=UPI003D334036